MTHQEIEGEIQVKQILLEHSREALSTQQDRLGDLSQKDNRGLLAFGRILTFWCADAIIRMIGVVEGNLPQFVWWKIYDEAVTFAEGLNLNKLTKLWQETHKSKRHCLPIPYFDLLL